MFTTARQCGPWAGGRIQPSLERFSTRQTSPPVETGSNGRRNPFIAGGNTKSKWPSCAGGEPWHAQFSQNPSVRAEWLFAGIIDRALDGGPGDHDLDDFETDTAIPDDDDDIVC